MRVLASSTTTRRSAEYTPEELDLLLYSEPRKHTGLAYNTYEGLVYKFNRKYVARDIQTLSPRIRQQGRAFFEARPLSALQGYSAQPGRIEL